MKSTPVQREVCSTYAGYKKHRKHNEEICGPCRLAMNVYRREYHKRKPEKNAKYQKNYRSKPEVQEAIKQYHKNYHKNYRRIKTPEQIAAQAERLARAEQRKQEKREISARFAIVKQEREKRRKEQELRKLTKLLKAKLKALLEQEQKLAYQQKLSNAAKKRQDRILRIQRKKKAALLKKLSIAEKRKARILLWEQRKNQHGVTVGDYDRCRKLNGSACGLCRAKAAEYVRSKKNEPRYKEHRRHHNRIRDKRVRANGFEYYTTDDVLAKWGYNCHICNDPIDFKAPRQCGDPGWELGLHLDHVIPIARGGPDTLANVKPAHAKCNVIVKRDLIL